MNSLEGQAIIRIPLENKLGAATGNVKNRLQGVICRKHCQVLALLPHLWCHKRHSIGTPQTAEAHGSPAG